MGQFKGIRNNNGRPKGTPNKTTNEIRQKFNDFIDNNLEKLQKDLDKLTPKERVDAVIRLLPYIIPKLSEVSIDNTTEDNANRPIMIIDAGIHPDFFDENGLLTYDENGKVCLPQNRN